MAYLLPDVRKPEDEGPRLLPEPDPGVRWPLTDAVPGFGGKDPLRGSPDRDEWTPSGRPASVPEPEPRRAGGRRSLTVLLPALNEEAAVGSVIDRVPIRALGSAGYEVRVWVVDGQSTDGTLEVARERGAQVFVQSGEGKGNGVRQALDHLTDRAHPGPAESYYVMLDADGSYPPEQIRRLLHELESGADVVLGSRFLGHMEDGAISDLNRLGNRMLSLLASFLYRVPVSDVCTGMWGFREGCLRRLGLGARGFDLEADLYAAACYAGARLAEVPVDYRQRIGEPKLIPLRTGFLIAWRLVSRRLNRPQVRTGRSLPRRRHHPEGVA